MKRGDFLPKFSYKFHDYIETQHVINTFKKYLH